MESISHSFDYDSVQKQSTCKLNWHKETKAPPMGIFLFFSVRFLTFITHNTLFLFFPNHKVDDTHAADAQRHGK